MIKYIKMHVKFKCAPGPPHTAKSRQENYMYMYMHVYLRQSLVHFRGGFLHGRLLNEGTCQLRVLSTNLVGCLLYQRLQLFSLGL